MMFLFDTFTPASNDYPALADTIATQNYLTEEALSSVQDTEPSDGPEVQVSNRNIITPISHTSYGISEELSDGSQHIFIFDQLKTGSLISIGQLYNDD